MFLDFGIFMSDIYKNYPEVPIPPEASPNFKNGQVSYYYYTVEADGTKRHRKIIGHATSKTMMRVTDWYRIIFPHNWRKYFGHLEQERNAVDKIHAGLFALTLGIVVKNSLYDVLQDSFGPQYANEIIDYCMYSMRYRSNTTHLFKEEMHDQMLFSRDHREDSYYSRLFSTKITDAMVHNFRAKWLTKCKDNGSSNVWLCIDGSNNDCAVDDSDLAEFGHAKSLKETEIVSYIWAVNAEDGRPVTCFTNPGGMPDCKAVKEIVQFLHSSDLDVKGVIVDRGFATQEFFDLVRDCKIDNITMLKSNSSATVEMMKRHWNEIRLNMAHIVSPEPVFGITDKVKVFAKSPEPSCVGLFYASLSGNLKVSKLIGQIWDAAEEVRKQIKANAKKVTVPAAMRKYLEFTTEGDKITGVDFNYQACQKAIDDKGYYAIASGNERSAKEIHDLYQLRDKSEKQFSIFKSQLNFDTTRVHSDQSVKNRLMIGFIASIIRTELVLACKALKLDDANSMLRKLDKAFFTRSAEGQYMAVYNLTAELKTLFGYFDIQEAHFGKFVQEYNQVTKVYSQVRKIPSLEEEAVHSGRGRKKGSKNKKTIEREERERADRAAGIPKPEPRPVGRPKGSKNKSTIEKEKKLQEAKAKGEYVEPQKRGRGRPKGSKNKKTLERQARDAELIARIQNSSKGQSKKGKNKKTVEQEAPKNEAQEQTSNTAKEQEVTAPVVEHGSSVSQPQATPEPSNERPVEKDDQSHQSQGDELVKSPIDDPPD